jgi:hypothetical protein
MTFAYVGYIWSLLGCAAAFVFMVAVAVGLYGYGRRRERGGPRAVVDVLRQGPDLNATDRADGDRS